MKRVELVLFMIDARYNNHSSIFLLVCLLEVSWLRMCYAVARERLTVADEDVAAWMRGLIKDASKLLLVANKCESLATDSGKSLEGADNELGFQCGPVLSFTQTPTSHLFLSH